GEPHVEVEPPCAARADRLAKAGDVAYHQLRWLPRSGEAQMVIRFLILPFHEQGPCELQPDPEQAGIAIQDPAKQSFGLMIVPALVAAHRVEEITLNYRVSRVLSPRLRPAPAQPEREWQ